MACPGRRMSRPPAGSRGTVRAAGAVPATIAVLNARSISGSPTRKLDTLARPRGVAKLSRADLAICLAAAAPAPQTVAATMIAARAAGIAVFATRGIGGVHRGAERSFDISADLQELAQTPSDRCRRRRQGDPGPEQDAEVLETLGFRSLPLARTRCRPSVRRQAAWPRRCALTPLRQIRRRPQDARRALACPGGNWSPTRSPRRTRSRPRPSPPLIETAIEEADAQGIAAKTGHALPAAAPFPADRRLVADRQYRPCAQQCPARRRDCLRIGQALSKPAPAPLRAVVNAARSPTYPIRIQQGERT